MVGSDTFFWQMISNIYKPVCIKCVLTDLFSGTFSSRFLGGTHLSNEVKNQLVFKRKEILNDSAIVILMKFHSIFRDVDIQSCHHDKVEENSERPRELLEIFSDATQLIIQVNSSHVGVVVRNCQWTWDFFLCKTLISLGFELPFTGVPFTGSCIVDSM